MHKKIINENYRFFLTVFLTLAMVSAGAIPAAGESPAIDETAAGKIVVCTDNLRLRTAPSLDAETIALLKEGTEAVVTAVGRPFSADGIDSRWCRVMTEGFGTGWCFGGYLSPKEGAWGDVSARKRWESPEGDSVCVSPSGAWALAVDISMNGAEGSVYLYRADTGKLEKKYFRRCDLVSKAATFAGEDERIFYPTSDVGSTYDWVESDLPTNAAGKSYSPGSVLREYGHTTLLEASEDGAWFALGFDGNNVPAVAFYNTSQRRWTRVDDREFLFPISYAFSPDSSLCAGSASNRAGTRVWDMRTMKTLWKRDMVAGHVFFSRDGTRLYCFNEDLTVLDAKTGTTVKTVPLGLAAGTVARSIAYTRDRSTLVVSNGTEF
ncbi:MAG TPA: SH3 domain-containing protein, partial [Treponemataceae bacterium]|nr:SH3 domain-containing protein [Treponemataceae bacterium]